MKKLLLIFILVAGYGISVLQATPAKNVENSKCTVVSTTDESSAPSLEDKKKDKKKTEATVETKVSEPCCAGTSEAVTPANETSPATPATGCSAAQMKSCAAAGKSCAAEVKKEEKKEKK